MVTERLRALQPAVVGIQEGGSAAAALPPHVDLF